MNCEGLQNKASKVQQPQQTGMLFMQRQQVQPAAHMAIMQSQQAWIIEQQAGSPLVQVMQTPSSVISHLHMPIVMLQQQTIMPFIIMQQLHMPPAIMVQRFCIIVADIVSSHLQVIFMPPLHFSIVIVQRGTIIHCGVVGMAAVPPIAPGAMGPMPVIMLLRSIIIALVIAVCPCWRSDRFLPDLARSRLLTSTIINAPNGEFKQIHKNFYMNP
ncbi:MAG: hypothetical protein ACLQU5_24525 [Isosphaeraceae bacterium]